MENSFPLCKLEHSGKGSDPNIYRIPVTRTFQKKHHHGKTTLRVVPPHKEELLPCMESWRADFSKHSNVHRGFGFWTSHTHRRVKATPCLLKGSEVQRLHTDDMQQSLSPVPAWPHCRQEPHLLGNFRQTGINTFTTAWMA